MVPRLGCLFPVPHGVLQQRTGERWDTCRLASRGPILCWSHGYVLGRQQKIQPSTRVVIIAATAS